MMSMEIATCSTLVLLAAVGAVPAVSAAAGLDAHTGAGSGTCIAFDDQDFEGTRVTRTQACAKVANTRLQPDSGADRPACLAACLDRDSLEH